MRADDQTTLWESVRITDSKRNDAMNGAGPYKLAERADICRHFDCNNYEACLDFAAAKKWPSFTCEGCRKTFGGIFVE